MTGRHPLALVFALSLTGALAACDSGPIAPGPDVPGTAFAVADSRQPLDLVADGVVGALARPAVRTQMIALLRSSPWTEHKVSLTDAMAANNGSLRREAAAALGISEASFATALSSLPAMDFYLADREQRRNWKGPGDVRLAVSSDNKSFTTKGGSGSGDALFALHPAEPKAYRIGRQSSTAGNVIEDATDGGGGLTIEFVNNRGQSVTLDVGASGMSMNDLKDYLVAEGAPITSTEGAPRKISGTLTAVEYVANQYITDGIGTAEIEWKAWKYIGGTTYNEYKLRWTGVDPYVTLLSNSGCGSYSGCIPYALQMWAWVPSSSDYVKGQVWETDTGSDDLYGTVYWADTEGGSTKTFWGGPQYCVQGGSQVQCADGRVNYY